MGKLYKVLWIHNLVTIVHNERSFERVDLSIDRRQITWSEELVIDDDLTGVSFLWSLIGSVDIDKSDAFQSKFISVWGFENWAYEVCKSLIIWNVSIWDSGWNECKCIAV